MRVVKARRNGIVRRVTAAAAVTRFLSHLSDAGSSPNTICAHSYDLRHTVSFLDKPAIGWNELRASTALAYLAHLQRVPSQRPAQRLDQTVDHRLSTRGMSVRIWDREELGRRPAANAHTGSTTLLSIHACLPTCWPRVNPHCSKSSTVALNRKRPCASRPVVTSEMASTRPPPAWAIWSSAPSSAARAMPWPRCFLST